MGGGGSVDFQIPWEVNLKDSKTIDVRPARGDFGIADARIIARGDPLRSVLYYRMAKCGSGRMPHLGSELPDELGLELVSRWIISMTAGSSRKIGSLGGVDEQLRSMDFALKLARRTSSPHRVEPSQRREVLAKAAAISNPAIRDLFEHLQPPESRRQTLGAQPNPAMILAAKGDPFRGRELFWNSSALQCKTCHRVGSEGVNLGPELTKIAGQRTRSELLESLIQPSAKIEAKYQNTIVQTKDGVTTTGIIVSRDAKEVVLRDAKNQEVRISADNIERLQPSKASLMPDGVFKDLTAQDAADLLEYLAGLK